MNVPAAIFTEKSIKMKQASTQHEVHGVHLIGSHLEKPVGSHIIIRLSQSKSEVSHALNAHYLVIFDLRKFQSLSGDYSSLRVKQHGTTHSNC